MRRPHGIRPSKELAAVERHWHRLARAMDARLRALRLLRELARPEGYVERDLAPPRGDRVVLTERRRRRAGR